MKAFIKVTALFLLIFIPFFSANAAQISSGADVLISQEEEIKENLYVAGGNVILDSPVSGDVTIAGGTVVLKNTINGDVMIAGGDVSIEGNVLGDVRVVGGNITLSGNIRGDFASFGGGILTKDSAIVAGQSLLIGGTLDHYGTIDGPMKVLVGKVVVDGNIKGPAQITTQKITFKSKTAISNQLAYFAPEKGLEENGANLGSAVTFNKIQTLQENGLIKQAFLNFINFWILLRFITTLLMAFILVFVFKVFSQRVSEYALDSFGKSLIAGFIFTVFFPVISIILAVSLIAIPFSILSILAYFMIMIIGGAVAGIIVGSLLKQALFKKTKDEVDFQTAALGVILLTLIQFVPYIGDFTRILFFFVAVGSVVHYVYMNIRWRKVS